MAALAFTSGAAPFRYVGGDVSLLPDYESANAKYFNENGSPISDVLKFCYDEGMNCMRVRLFVDPEHYTGPEQDANAKQTLEYITPLCQRIQAEGMALMLDFHYSDTWADPAKQWTPKAWEGLTDEQLYQKIYDYTKETLRTLRDSGVVPEFIQPGNEISYGMLWGQAGTGNKKYYAGQPANAERFFTLLKQAIKGCREECPDAKIIIHTERVANANYLKQFYTDMDTAGIDYDIIGLSYYPYFHGTLTVLRAAMNTLQSNFPSREVMIVETGYSYAWEVPGTDKTVEYPYSEEGQAKFAKELVETLLGYENCTGLFWWWFEYNAYNTSLSGWYNAPLFDSRTGKVTKAFKELCSFGSGKFDSGITEVGADENGSSGLWYDMQGRRVGHPSAPGLYIHDGKKLILK